MNTPPLRVLGTELINLLQNLLDICQRKLAGILIGLLVAMQAAKITPVCNMPLKNHNPIQESQHLLPARKHLGPGQAGAVQDPDPGIYIINDQGLLALSWPHDPPHHLEKPTLKANRRG